MKLNPELQEIFRAQMARNLNQGRISSLPDDIIYNLSTFLRKDDAEDVFPIFGIKKHSKRATFEICETTKTAITFNIMVKYFWKNMPLGQKVSTMRVKIIKATLDLAQKKITLHENNMYHNQRVMESIIKLHVPNTFNYKNI